MSIVLVANMDQARGSLPGLVYHHNVYYADNGGWVVDSSDKLGNACNCQSSAVPVSQLPPREPKALDALREA